MVRVCLAWSENRIDLRGGAAQGDQWAAAGGRHAGVARRWRDAAVARVTSLFGRAVLAAILAAGAVGCVKPQEDVTGVQSAVLTNVVVTVVDTGGLAQANVTVFWKNSSGTEGGWTATDSTRHA